jgi:hypothetical protein
MFYDVLRCAHCGEAIGVYEPLVVVTDVLSRESSIASDPAVRDIHGEHYHRGCYETACDVALERSDARNADNRSPSCQ